jgi:hypothetical protein
MFLETNFLEPQKHFGILFRPVKFLEILGQFWRAYKVFRNLRKTV